MSKTLNPAPKNIAVPPAPDLSPNVAPLRLWGRMPLVARIRLIKLGIIQPHNDNTND